MAEMLVDLRVCVVGLTGFEPAIPSSRPRFAVAAWCWTQCRSLELRGRVGDYCGLSRLRADAFDASSLPRPVTCFLPALVSNARIESTYFLTVRYTYSVAFAVLVGCGARWAMYRDAVARPEDTGSVPEGNAEREVGHSNGDAVPRYSVESRWPPALAIASFVAITIVFRLTVPHHPSLSIGWLVPGFEVLLLVVIVAADPQTIGRYTTLFRRAGIVLVVGLVVAAIAATVVLTADLIRGEAVTNDAGSLLASGGLVWAGNNVAFGFLYWMFDAGGPRARSRAERRHPDFLFPQHTDPDFAPAGWRPMFVDYFYLGFTNAMGFSPTDVMPLAPWAKLTMLLQATISLAIIGLVIARAVSVFT